MVYQRTKIYRVICKGCANVMIEQIKDALSRNKLKKIIALIMSMALWVYVMGSQNPVIEDSYHVKVRIRNAPSEYKAFYEEQDAKVKLSAPRSYFIDYNESDIHAYIDISDYGEGEYDLPIEASYPKGFELNEISPKTVHVKIEPIIERQMEVQLITSGSPKPNTVIKTIDSLKNITVVGPKNLVDTVRKVTGYVVIVGEDNDFEIDVPLSALDENGREVSMIRVVPTSIKAYVDIEAGAKKTVPIVANITPPDGKVISKITVSPANVDIEGLKEVVDNLSSIRTVEFTPPADKKLYKSDLTLEVPEHIKTSVSEVSVTVELKNIQSQNQAGN